MTEEAFSSEAALPEIGFYYPDQFWYFGDRIKFLILFFDRVGLPVKRWLLSASTSLHSHLRSTVRIRRFFPLLLSSHYLPGVCNVLLRPFT